MVVLVGSVLYLWGYFYFYFELAYLKTTYFFIVVISYSLIG